MTRPIERVRTPSYLLVLGTATREARSVPSAHSLQFRIDCIGGHYLSSSRVIVTFNSEKHLV
jgi:hypothetical protein